MKTFDHYRWRLLLFALLALFFLVTSAFGAGRETRLEASGPKGLKGILTFADEPLRTMTEIPFSLKLYNAGGTEVVGASLAVDLDMPAMPMPKNSPRAAWQGGAYQGVAVFTMAGAWQVEVRVKLPDGSEERLSFDIEQVLMK